MLSLQGKDPVFGSDSRSVAKDKVAYAQFQLVVETINTLHKSSEKEVVTKSYRTFERLHTITGPVVMKEFRHLGKGRGTSRWRKWLTLTFHGFLGKIITRQSLYL